MPCPGGRTDGRRGSHGSWSKLLTLSSPHGSGRGTVGKPGRKRSCVRACGRPGAPHTRAQSTHMLAHMHTQRERERARHKARERDSNIKKTPLACTHTHNPQQATCKRARVERSANAAKSNFLARSCAHSKSPEPQPTYYPKPEVTAYPK